MDELARHVDHQYEVRVSPPATARFPANGFKHQRFPAIAEELPRLPYVVRAGQQKVSSR